MKTKKRIDLLLGYVAEKADLIEKAQDELGISTEDAICNAIRKAGRLFPQSEEVSDE